MMAAVLLPFPASGAGSVSHKYLTKSGKVLLIVEHHPVGESLSDISIRSEGFSHEFSETFTDQDPIRSVFVADLDRNGFYEFYIITVSSGSGSYGKVIAFASNRDKSLSMIYYPEFREGIELLTGYMGHVPSV